MTDLQLLKETLKKIGAHCPFQESPSDGSDPWCSEDDLPDGIKECIRYKMMVGDDWWYFDENGNYLGAVLGDEQPVWESRVQEDEG